MTTHKLTPEIINAAILGFEEQKRHISTQITELRAMLHGPNEAVATPEGPKPKRKLSAAGRRAIVTATKKRWAAFHAAKKKAEKPAMAKKAAPKKASRKVVKKATPRVAKKNQKKVAKTPEKAVAVPAQ